MLTMDQDCITYRETPLPLALRGFIAVLAVGVGLGIPAAWLANVTTQTSWPMLALLVVVVGGCLTLGGFFLLLVLVSATELQIDPTQPDALRIRRIPPGDRSLQAEHAALAGQGTWSATPDPRTGHATLKSA